MRSKPTNFEYDVAISYASEDEAIATQIAKALEQRTLSIFFAPFSRGTLWGKEQSKFFEKTYGGASRFVLALISHYYPIKDWTGFEITIARAEEKKRKTEFILPVRLDNTRISGLPADKAYLDFRKDGLTFITDSLFDKVRKNRGETSPQEVFTESYQGWKMKGFLAGESKARYFLDNLSTLSLDTDTCEFFLRSLSGIYEDKRDKLGVLDKQPLFDAATRMLNEKDSSYAVRWRAITYLVFADPQKAGSYLWDIYKDTHEDLSLRKDSFQRLWKCKHKQGIDESYAIASKEKHWELRRAAVANIGRSKLRQTTSVVLANALKDRRGEVRAEAAYAIARLKLNDLVPNLILILENEPSRKCSNRLAYAISMFNTHPRVAELKDRLPPWIYKTPDYHALYKDLMDDMV